MEGEIFAATKLEIPRPRTGLVPRDDLVALLARPGPHRLTLVAAPAGFGKTTLLSQWATAPIESRPFAWLSLDPEDSDPVRLWYGIIAALDRVLPGIGKQARAALRARGTSLTRTAVPLLINDLAMRPEPLVLVLDDLHLIEQPEALRALTLLIERAPAGLHVAATARADPPLELPRMRARGQLLEVRAEDLRFSRDEAAAMLHGLGLDVEPAQLESLQSQTEGWA